MRKLKAEHQSWPLAKAFAISRGSRTSSEVVVAEISDGAHVGRAECMPYARYDETVEGVVAEIERFAGAVSDGLDRAALQDALPAGAARNALDCALWDLEAKQTGTPVWQLAGLSAPASLVTAYTLSLDVPEKMALAAQENAFRPLMKLKLTGEGDIDRVSAVREAAPNTRLIVDANEGWSPEMVAPFSTELAALGVEMIEQPIPAAKDAALAECQHPVPICADESCHTTADLDALAGRYEMVNIKLDKTGGLTEALALRDAAREWGMTIMIGCMIGTSLAMAPAVLVAQGAEVVDLDGPLLLAKDQPNGLVYDGSIVNPSTPALWG
ncbi:MAG: L-Ala-D/L-Glu epimerase [Alphaproteobacteria bacterium]|nr:L-Ala-D/L-Glu epimerase [Alphaproteobacteria bacterium]